MKIEFKNVSKKFDKTVVIKNTNISENIGDFVCFL